MKDFRFSAKVTTKIVAAFNRAQGVDGLINDVMALSSVNKCYGVYNKIYVFRTYLPNSKYVFAFYEKDNIILSFDDESSAYKYIFAY